MATGIVKLFNSERDFGFIAPDEGGPDVFVHVSGIVSGTDKLKENQRASFEIGTDDRKGKPLAKSVRVI